MHRLGEATLRSFIRTLLQERVGRYDFTGGFQPKTGDVSSTDVGGTGESGETGEKHLTPDAQEIAQAYPKMESYAQDIIDVSERLGIEPKWLANVINFESKGGDPTAVNPRSNATGLIQFIPSTASKLGTSTGALLQMSGKEQMKWVEKYLTPYKGKMNKQEDVYTAVFFPSALGNQNFALPEWATLLNPNIKTPDDYARKANSAAKLT